jgi:hypothetical protein
MKLKPSYILAILLGGLSSWSPAAQNAPEITAFLDVTVIPMDTERTLPNHTVVVRGDRIIEVAPSERARIPESARRVEGRGKFLLPGLAEMHGHNPAPGSPEEFIEAVYFMFIANGVTTVRSMLGWPGQLELRDKVQSGAMPGPTLLLAGPSFSGASIQSPAQAEQRVREQKKEGWDLLKVHPGLKRSEFDAMARTAKEVGMEFSGHIPAEVGLAHALEMGQATVDHLDGYIEFLEASDRPMDPSRLAEVIQLTRKHDAWVVPTMLLWETILGAADLEKMSSYPELKYMPPAQVEQWKTAFRRITESPGFDKERAQTTARNRMELLKALHAADVKILFGTDAPQMFSVPGFSIHRELRAMEEAGLTPYQILETATRKVGDYLSKHDSFGTIAAGQRADLLLVEGNPLEDLKNLQRRTGVMVRGQWIDENRIQERLKQIAEANARR